MADLSPEEKTGLLDKAKLGGAWRGAAGNWPSDGRANVPEDDVLSEMLRR